ncbi:MAG TPA: hypothetical protein VGN33_00610 [Leifsonia sp.]|jgi:hypothetical protein|nr:hypothetical protein [Leifsonia sp.]
MSADPSFVLPSDPDPEYSYGGFTVRIDPIPGTDRRWRVTSLSDDGDPKYFGEVSTADPVNGDEGIHYASHFPGEERIPPTTVDSNWTKSVQFLIDAKDKD